MKTVITSRADLRAIGRHISSDNPRRAISFTDELICKCEEVASNPEAYPLVKNHEADGIRRRVHGRYLILYRLQGRYVMIVHIRHGSRNVDRILFGDD